MGSSFIHLIRTDSKVYYILKTHYLNIFQLLFIMTVEQELHEHKSEHNLSFNIYIGICSEHDSRAKTVDTMEKVAALSHDVKHFSWREWMRSILISKINATLQSNTDLCR